MKLGDILENSSVPEGNPYRKSVFIRYSGNYIVTILCNGKQRTFSKLDQKKDNFLKIVDHIDIRGALNE